MTRTFALLALGLAACQPPPAEAPKRTLQLYMHPNGLSRCVEIDGDRWKADPSCCPKGFEVAGFSVPSAIEYLKDEKKQRTLYRHLVCMEGAPQ